MYKNIVQCFIIFQFTVCYIKMKFKKKNAMSQAKQHLDITAAYGLNITLQLFSIFCGVMF